MESMHNFEVLPYVMKIPVQTATQYCHLAVDVAKRGMWKPILTRLGT